MTTTSRLLHLLSLLQARRDWPGPLLASRLDVSDRTVRRDVDRLREMGYTVRATMGPEGGYRLDAGSELPPLLFDDDQTVAVAVALQATAGMGGGIEEAGLRALATVRQVMPSRLRHRLDAFAVTAVGRPGDAASADVSLDVLMTLANGIRDRRVLRFDYADRGGDDGERRRRETRRVEPHHLVTSHGRWYLVAWDLERDDWRLFRVDRIDPRCTGGPPFTPRVVPGGDVHDFVSARFKGSLTDTWPCRGTVVLELPAREVLPYAGDGTVEALGERRCSLEAGSWSWGSLAASYGRFDVPMHVVGPPQLAAAFATLAKRYAATGDTGHGSTSPSASGHDGPVTTLRSAEAR